jgi:hypothetical protein
MFLNIKPTIYILSLTVLINTLPSCYSGKKNAARKLVAATKEVTTGEDAQIATINNLKVKKIEEENIDSSIDNRISATVKKYQTQNSSIKSTASRIEELLKSGRQFRKLYKNEVLPATITLKKYNQTAGARIYRFTMIIDGLSLAEKKLFEMAAFFGPGKYVIPEDKMQFAFEKFSPITDSLAKFANKYSDIKQSASLIVNAFADATGVSPGSPLYQTLVEALKKESAEKAELNMQLSKFRATAVANVIDTLIKRNVGSLTSPTTFNYNIYEYAQGETLPSKKITDYTVDDPRRRVVLIFWAVLPDEE